MAGRQPAALVAGAGHGHDPAVRPARRRPAPGPRHLARGVRDPGPPLRARRPDADGGARRRPGPQPQPGHPHRDPDGEGGPGAALELARGRPRHPRDAHRQGPRPAGARGTDPRRPASAPTSSTSPATRTSPRSAGSWTPSPTAWSRRTPRWRSGASSAGGQSRVSRRWVTRCGRAASTPSRSILFSSYDAKLPSNQNHFAGPRRRPPTPGCGWRCGRGTTGRAR